MMMNPVLRRELKTSLRNWRTFGAITLYVFLTALGACLFLYATMYHSYNYGFDPEQVVGFYSVLCAIQMGFVLIVTPALTAGSISGERERQTLDLLLVTKMSQFSIVIGKLLSSIGLVLLMTFATLPIFGIVFYFGGLSLWALLGMMGFILLTGCVGGTVAIFFSCLFRRTMVSMVLAYLFLGVLCFGTLLATVIYYSVYWSMYQQQGTAVLPMVLLVANPGVGFFSILDAQIGSDIVQELIQIQQIQNPNITWILSHYWLLTCIAEGILSVLFIALATYFVNPIRGKHRGKK